ncbi:hypothetical protein BJY00DRAFT_317113 [Aspergillus carlsbadensis]|nr:hypothetical protein BJY00DRAFT_317113 [Aspergillus carlsbadensis]
MSSSENNEDFVKNIVGVRRRPNMTRKEFYDHHYRVHGYLSDYPEDKDIKPHKYMQTHVFDSAFGNSLEGLNANHPWVGRDDVTELYFRDLAHLGSTFSSPYLGEKIAPDGLKFAESGPPTAVLAREKRVPLKSEISLAVPEGSRTVAMLFLSLGNGLTDSEKVEKLVSPILAHALQSQAPKDAWGLIVNVDIDLGFDMMAFFGGKDMPTWRLVYKVLIKDRASTTNIRKAQGAFYEAAAEYINSNDSFILFGIEGLINDVDRDLSFDLGRQPRLDELPGPSHLDDLQYSTL